MEHGSVLIGRIFAGFWINKIHVKYTSHSHTLKQYN
jgi:hypothetical protein